MTSLEPLSLSPLGVELLDDPAADPGGRRPPRSATSRGPTAGSAARPRCAAGWPARSAGVSPGTSRARCSTSAPALGDLPRAAVRWAARRGITARARRTRAESGRGASGARPEASRASWPAPASPPLRDKSVDVVLVSQVAHHLSAESAVRLFRDCDRVARRAVVVADLRRGRLGPLAFWVGARAAPVRPGHGRRRHDLDPPRLHRRRSCAALLAAAGVRATVERRPGYRLVATWRPGAP